MVYASTSVFKSLRCRSLPGKNYAGYTECAELPVPRAGKEAPRERPHVETDTGKLRQCERTTGAGRLVTNGGIMSSLIQEPRSDGRC